MFSLVPFSTLPLYHYNCDMVCHLLIDQLLVLFEALLHGEDPVDLPAGVGDFSADTPHAVMPYEVQHIYPVMYVCRGFKDLTLSAEDLPPKLNRLVRLCDEDVEVGYLGKDCCGVILSGCLHDVLVVADR